MLSTLIATTFLACTAADKDGLFPVDSGAVDDPVDLVSPVPTGQARAGEITDAAALFGGISAEGQVGDFMLKNDRVRFVVQSERLGSYYISEGGGVIDADLVRPDGQPGRDLLDEHVPMATLARILQAETVTVVADGQDGGAAIVRAEGPVGSLALIQGAVESTSIVPDVDARMQTDYILEPDSWLLRMESRITWSDGAMSIEPGQLALVSYEVGAVWRPGRGFDDGAEADPGWVGLMAERNDVALGLFPDSDGFSESPLQDLLEAVGQIVAGMSTATTIEPGDTHDFVGYLGVGPDIDTIQEEWLLRRGKSVDTVSGQVLDSDGAPVAGARVHLRDADGQVLTLALTDDDGAFQASAPAGRVVDAVATARGGGRHWAVAPGAGWSGPYADDTVNTISRASLQAGSAAPPYTVGYGVSDATAVSGGQVQLVLDPPGFLNVSAADGGPAMVVVSYLEGDPAAEDPLTLDERMVPDRPSGHAAHAYLGAGSLQVPLEPGPYQVLVHRGLRFEPHLQTLDIRAGEEAFVEALLPPAYSPDGVLVGDPHMHASPSNDAEVTMEQRLLTAAANGVDLHFGTDHDHIVDYRPLVTALGLDGHLASVVADEVSPPPRGHFNTWPLEEQPDKQNNGAVRWWERWQELGSTDGLFAAIRAEMHPAEGAIIALNHPIAGSSGMASAAGWDPETGTVQANKWGSDFDAIEVLNANDYVEYLELYLDLVSRGLEPTPLGVSDAHGPDSSVGAAVTFFDLGVDDVTQVTNADLLDVMDRRATVVSRGPYIQATIDGDWAPGRTVDGPVEVEVAVYGASFVQVDSLQLWRDGVMVQSVPVEGAAPEQLRTSFTLDPDVDAAYVFIAEGATSMAPVYSRTPWAMTAAIRVDADGDGSWDSPKPPLTLR